MQVKTTKKQEQKYESKKYKIMLVSQSKTNCTIMIHFSL